MTPETETMAGSGRDGPQEVPETNPEWEAMDALVRKVVAVPKIEIDRREALYKASRQGKTRGHK